MFKTQKLKSKLKPNKSKSKLNVKLSKKTHTNRKKNNKFSKNKKNIKNIKKIIGGTKCPNINEEANKDGICVCKKGYTQNIDGICHNFRCPINQYKNDDGNCICKANRISPDCSECEDGYYENDYGDCICKPKNYQNGKCVSPTTKVIDIIRQIDAIILRVSINKDNNVQFYQTEFKNIMKLINEIYDNQEYSRIMNNNELIENYIINAIEMAKSYLSKITLENHKNNNDNNDNNVAEFNEEGEICKDAKGNRIVCTNSSD